MNERSALITPVQGFARRPPRRFNCLRLDCFAHPNDIMRGWLMNLGLSSARMVRKDSMLLLMHMVPATQGIVSGMSGDGMFA